MGVSSTEASLRAVRADLDLNPSGSILENVVLNRVNKRYGPVNLSEHKGVAMGAQLRIAGNWNDPPDKRYNGYKGYYPTIAGNPSISGDRITLVANLAGSGAPDGSCEYRCPFKVTEDGTYKLTSYLEFNEDQYYRSTKWQVAIVTSPTGYLSGITNLDLNKSGNSAFNGPASWNVNLSTSRPYGVVVLYALRVLNGDASKPGSSSKWTNTRLAKI